MEGWKSCMVEKFLLLSFYSVVMMKAVLTANEVCRHCRHSKETVHKKRLLTLNYVVFCPWFCVNK